MAKRKIQAPPGHYGCTKCGQVKPLSSFHAKKDGGYSPHCRACKVQSNRELAARNASRPIEDFADRFWAKVEKTDGCWNWIGATNSKGYGHMWTNKPSPEMAHHIAMRLAGLKAPSKAETDECVDHKCRNPRCVRLEHLRVVTQRINAIENNSSPSAQNAAKTHCGICGTEYAGANLALRIVRPAKKRPYVCRVCLNCHPNNWMFAVIKRDGPPNARVKWVGPQSLPC